MKYLIANKDNSSAYGGYSSSRVAKFAKSRLEEIDPENKYWIEPIPSENGNTKFSSLNDSDLAKVMESEFRLS